MQLSFKLLVVEPEAMLPERVKGLQERYPGVEITVSDSVAAALRTYTEALGTGDPKPYGAVICAYSLPQESGGDRKADGWFDLLLGLKALCQPRRLPLPRTMVLNTVDPEATGLTNASTNPEDWWWDAAHRVDGLGFAHHFESWLMTLFSVSPSSD